MIKMAIKCHLQEAAVVHRQFWTNPSSSFDSPLQQPPHANSLYQEHRCLFGYNPRFNPYSRNRPNRKKGFVKPKRVQTWARQFICLAKRDQTNPPQLWEYSRLQAAGLGEKKISLDLGATTVEVDTKRKKLFPWLD